MPSYTLHPVHITAIKPGDTVMHKGHLKTVCASDITRSDFMGLAIFGDTYCMGLHSVERVSFAVTA